MGQHSLRASETHSGQSSIPFGQSGHGDQPYPHLLAPLVVRNLRLRNRMVMGAMHTRLESMDRPVERIQAFYRARSEGEIALIITGGISPNLAGRMEDVYPDIADQIAVIANGRGSMPAFGSALTEIQQIAGGYFASKQGGSVWTSPAVGRLAHRMRDLGAQGIGQSSWGPTGFAFVDTPDAAQRLYDSLVEEAKGDGLSILVARGRNTGASVEAIQSQRNGA